MRFSLPFYYVKVWKEWLLYRLSERTDPTTQISSVLCLGQGVPPAGGLFPALFFTSLLFLVSSSEFYNNKTIILYGHSIFFLDYHDHWKSIVRRSSIIKKKLATALHCTALHKEGHRLLISNTNNRYGALHTNTYTYVYVRTYRSFYID